MRLLALLLLVANLAFLGWRYAVEEDERLAALRHDPPVPAGTPRLQTLPSQAGVPLAQPRPAPERLEAAGAAPTPTMTPQELAALSATSLGADPAASTGSGVCVANGPFARRGDADALNDWLRPRAARLQVRQEPLPGILRHALYLVPAPVAGKDEFAARPVEGNSLDHALLLGVLDDQASAAQRAAQVSQTGYVPLVVPRLDARAQWFVEAELANGYEDVGEVPVALVPGGTVAQVDCATL